ncbi:hypothetical protein MP228_002884 [Amoeboaphelidium protococcarum]|nr:hypothetical protein MP228_002884 [Amoeboaphelidium protococcarum]
MAKLSKEIKQNDKIYFDAQGVDGIIYFTRAELKKAGVTTLQYFVEYMQSPNCNLYPVYKNSLIVQLFYKNKEGQWEMYPWTSSIYNLFGNSAATPHRLVVPRKPQLSNWFEQRLIDYEAWLGRYSTGHVRAEDINRSVAPLEADAGPVTQTDINQEINSSSAVQRRPTRHADK